MQIWTHLKPIYKTFTLVLAMGGTTACGIFATRLIPVQTRCTSMCSSAATWAHGSLLGRYRSIWVVTYIEPRWAAQLRSSFAA